MYLCISVDLPLSQICKDIELDTHVIFIQLI